MIKIKKLAFNKIPFSIIFENQQFKKKFQENLDCPELIEAFEVARTKNSKKPEKRKIAGGEPKAKRKEGERARGFDRGLDPERIIGQ